MVDEQTAQKILRTYGEAWVGQDTDKLLSIFTEDGIYHERVLKEPMVGHDAIRQYWDTKVCKEQSGIEFKLLNHYVCEDDTIIAEWDASFNSRKPGNANSKKAIRIHIQEVAILKIEKGKIKSLREYWQAENLEPTTRHYRK